MSITDMAVPITKLSFLERLAKNCGGPRYSEKKAGCHHVVIKMRWYWLADVLEIDESTAAVSESIMDLLAG